MPRIKLEACLFCVNCEETFPPDHEESEIECSEAGGCVLVPAMWDPEGPPPENDAEAKLASGQPVSAFCCGVCPPGRFMVDNWRKNVPGSPDVEARVDET